MESEPGAKPQGPLSALTRPPRPLWRRLIDPAPDLVERDQRRQASLLSTLLLSLIVLGIVVESITVLLIQDPRYVGWRTTIVALLLVGLAYALSRTRRVELAAMLTVVFITAAVFLSGLSEPRGISEGFFAYLILPIWLGSLFIPLRRLAILIFGTLIVLLAVPLLSPAVSLNTILLGPFAFFLVTSALLVVITRQRDQVEADRRAELTSQEAQARREAARSAALLRVAERLNAQLDLDSVLKAISEELAAAMNTGAAIVTLYEPSGGQFVPRATLGLPDGVARSIPPLSKELYDQALHALGKVFSFSDLQSTPYLSFLAPFQEGDLRAIAFAAMEYEHELIGSLSALSAGVDRTFTQDELLLMKGLADQAALAIVNTRLYKDARRRLDHLQALRAIDIALATNRDLQHNLDVLLDEILDQLQVDASAFLLLDETGQQLQFAAHRGFRTNALQYTRLRVGEGMAGRAFVERKVLHIPDIRTDPRTLAHSPGLVQEGFVTYLAAPLIAQGAVRGVLEVLHRSKLEPDSEWLGFLEALAGQAAIGIESIALFEGLQRANDELRQAYDSTIEGWSHALDLRDKETEGHTQRVTRMALQLAEAMKIGADERVHIRRGALLHDIGKMGVPDYILLKPDKLTDEERRLIELHPVFAHDLLSPISYLRPALPIPHCHHEKWDGTGYPQGLRGEAIPLAARIFAIVDVYDALTSDRPYRRAWSPEKAIEHIRSLSGTHFDPEVVKAFLEIRGLPGEGKADG
jgi:putative nucleotidyltransferase with HDIG domain